MVDDIRDSLAFVLDNYQQTRQQVTNPRKDLPVCSRLLILKGLIDRACAENGFANLVVNASWGKGAWNPNPWIALLDPRIAETTRTGFYPVFLLRSDGSGFYLSLDLGTGRQYGTPSKAELGRLHVNAEYLSSFFTTLQAQGFSRSLPMDLRTDKGVAVGFAHGSIIHKLYDRTDLPSSVAILLDLMYVLKFYQSMCDSGIAGVLLDTVAGGEAPLPEEVIKSIARPTGRGQGFLSDPMVRLTIEEHAMQTAVDYFTSRGWEVTDVHRRNPYDLFCTRGCRSLMVEVKGTTSDGTTVLLTPNEVDHARNHPDEAALFVCSNIDVVVTQRGRLATQGGRVLLLHPWEPHPSLLTPLGYSFSVKPSTGSFMDSQN